jgi:hypothetical protein
VLDFKFAETPALMAERAAELVRANVDVIVASTSMPALAAKRATTARSRSSWSRRPTPWRWGW